VQSLSDIQIHLIEVARERFALLAMPPSKTKDKETGSRNWSAKQDECLMLVFVEIPPIGGEFDGKMGKRAEIIWKPILELFKERIKLVPDGALGSE
jgi:hypothetical protein